MNPNKHPSAVILAIGVFCLTVMLGIGGPAAVGLWEQSSSATMTVRAAVTTPTVTCTTLGANNAVELTITGVSNPTTVSVAVKLPTEQNYGAGVAGLAVLNSTVDITPATLVLAKPPLANNDVVTLRIAITQANLSVVTLEYSYVKLFSQRTKVQCQATL
ncbi:hypothetical protein [Paenarthrobacter ureafaciens]|uniref:hypothetical protein n=1 Tax=Paenarthrobacter ureafaciens TaxID=37931 RepID=UPI002DBCEBE4|nr:hypothetical protein [Paenarthrobacter ureafaciens]MEC3850833.1 hypothetical protein [Paenarthrobacter ureafaciens]